MSEHWAEVEQGRFRYLEWGHDHTETILFLHGFNQTSFSWDEVAQLAKNEFRLIAFDMRGHGDSMRDPNGDYSLETMVIDIFQLVENLQINKFHLCGLSMGAAVSLLFAATYPEKLKTLTLSEYVIDVREKGLDKLEKKSFDRMGFI